MRKTAQEILNAFEQESDTGFTMYERKPAESRQELIQKLMGRRQVLTSYVNKHKRDRASGKHVIAYLEQKETEELALVQASLDQLTGGI